MDGVEYTAEPQDIDDLDVEDDEDAEGDEGDDDVNGKRQGESAAKRQRTRILPPTAPTQASSPALPLFGAGGHRGPARAHAAVRAAGPGAWPSRQSPSRRAARTSIRRSTGRRKATGPVPGRGPLGRDLVAMAEQTCPPGPSARPAMAAIASKAAAAAAAAGSTFGAALKDVDARVDARVEARCAQILADHQRLQARVLELEKEVKSLRAANQ